MVDEPTFVDLYALTKINPDSVVEKFGSTINSSFFDASNILGGLKIKGLIDFTTLFGSQNAIVITDTGKELLDEANRRSSELFDNLDQTILKQLSGGQRSPNDLATALNIKQRDLALRLYKLQSQQYISTDFRNGVMALVLTEKGFMQAKSAVLPQDAQQSTNIQGQQTTTQPQQQVATAGTGPQQQQSIVQPNNTAQAGSSAQQTVNQKDTTTEPWQQADKKKRNKGIIVLAVIVIVVIVLVLFKLGMIPL